MGNYIFTTKVLIDAIRADADDDHSDHDMGGDIIPRLVGDGMAAVYDFHNNEVPGATERDHGYWRDVGTLDAFYDAHMDLVSVHPVFNLYNKRWPIRGESEMLAPAKFVNGGSAQESVVGAGSIISAASVRNSVLSSNVVVDDGAIVEGSVIMPGARVGRGAVVRHAILDKNVVVGPGEMVGVDLEKDRDRFAISAGEWSPSVRASGSQPLRAAFASSPTHDPDHRPHQHEHGHQHQHRYQDRQEDQPDAGDVLDGGQHRRGHPRGGDIGRRPHRRLRQRHHQRGDHADGDGNPLTRVRERAGIGHRGRLRGRAATRTRCRLPSAGRTSGSASLMLSSAGILSATISTTSSAATIVMTQPFSSQAQPCGSVTRSVNRDSRPSASSGM